MYISKKVLSLFKVIGENIREVYSLDSSLFGKRDKAMIPSIQT